MNKEPKYEIHYAAEKSRTRVWQDAQDSALRALIAAQPPRKDQIDAAPEGVEAYARGIVRASFAIADEVFKQHGPSVSTRLQLENPFVAAPGVKSESSDAAE